MSVFTVDVAGEFPRHLLPLPCPKLVDHASVTTFRPALLGNVVALAGERRIPALLARELSIAAYP